MVEGGGTGERIVAQAEVTEIVTNYLIVAIGHLTGSQPRFIGGDRNGCAMLISSRDHQDMVPFEPVVACKDIGGHSKASYMANMTWAVGVGPGNGDENMFWHT